jgi:hypothetical protein
MESETPSEIFHLRLSHQQMRPQQMPNMSAQFSPRPFQGRHEFGTRLAMQVDTGLWQPEGQS